MDIRQSIVRGLVLAAGLWVVGSLPAEARPPVPFEERQQMREQMREHWRQMPPEQRYERREEYRERWQQMPYDERQRMREEMREHRGGRHGGRHDRR